MTSRCCEFVDSRLRRSPPDRASAVPYGQAGENAMRFAPLAHRSAAAHKLHSTTNTTRSEFDSGKSETISRLPALAYSPRKLSKQPEPSQSDDNLLPFSFPAVQRKKITAAFDGGRITSDGGVMLLAQAERRLGIAERLAQVIPDRRDQDRVTHLLPDILRARIFAIACGYEDADDLDRLRCDPAFKLACGRLPDSGTDLCSQPTISRWENAPALRASTTHSKPSCTIGLCQPVLARMARKVTAFSVWPSTGATCHKR